MSHFSKEFLTWLDTNADHIDQESGPIADQLLEKIAENDVFKIGVPAEFDGLGGGPTQVVDVLNELAQHSLTASFISWGHRTFIDYILASDNAYPRETWLKELYTGERAGGTGLSNAVKFLSDIEELNVTLSQEGDDYYLDGRLPWVTNLRADKFAALFAADFENLLAIQDQLFSGLNDADYFIDKPRELFQLRIDIVDVVANSLLLELQASGGRGYLKESESSFIRRWNEGVFLPIVSPSAVQLRHILAAS